MRWLACCGSCFTQRSTGRDLAGCNFYSDAVLCVKGWEKCNFAIAGKQDKKSVSQGGFPQQNRKVKMRGKDNDFTELSVEMISTLGLGMQANEAQERNTQNHTNKTQKSLQISVKDVERFLPSQRSFPNTDAEVGRCVLHFFFPPLGQCLLCFRKLCEACQSLCLYDSTYFKCHYTRQPPVLEYETCFVPAEWWSPMLWAGWQTLLLEHTREREKTGCCRAVPREGQEDVGWPSGGRGVTGRHPSVAGRLVSVGKFSIRAG